MFKTRLISGIVLMAITIALMVNGGFPLFWGDHGDFRDWSF